MVNILVFNPYETKCNNLYTAQEVLPCQTVICPKFC